MVCQSLWKGQGEDRSSRSPCLGGNSKLLARWPTSISQRWYGAELFLSIRGKAISRKMVWVLVKLREEGRYRKKYLPPWTSSFFCNPFIDGWADIRSVQEMLGHADVGTTQIYTKVESERLLEEHTNFHLSEPMKIFVVFFSRVL